VRVDRTSAPPKLHRQHFARSSYRCGIPLTGTCNSIFKDEHPSLYRLLRPRSQSELRTSRRSAHFGDRRLGTIGIFFRSETWQPFTSDAPLPLLRRPRERRRIQCELGTPSFAGGCRVTAADFRQRQLGPLDRAVSRNQRRARTSTTTLTDFCNRHRARAHWQTIVTRHRAAFHDVALRLAALRRRVAAPTISARSQRRARHGSQL